MRKIAFINQKGGVGKTTSTANVGACLALREKKVLLIDLDPQGNLSMHLGVDPHNNDLSIYQIINGKNSAYEVLKKTGIKGLDLIPISIAFGCQRDSKRRHVLGIESGIDPKQLRKSGDRQDRTQ